MLVDNLTAARFYRIDVDPLPRWQHSLSLTIDHNDGGDIVAVYVNAAKPSLLEAA